MTELTTNRLKLIPFTDDHLDGLNTLNSAPVVDVNYPDRSATTILAGGSGE